MRRRPAAEFMSSRALVPWHHGPGELDVLAHVGVDGVLEHRHGVRVHRLDQFHFGQRRMLIQFARPPRDVRPLVGHALEVGRELHRRNHPAQIGRDRLKTQEQIDAILVHLLFELIDLLVIGDRDRAHLVVPLHQAGDGAIEAALGQARHHEDVVAQGRERFVEGSEDVPGCDHGTG